MDPLKMFFSNKFKNVFLLELAINCSLISVLAKVGFGPGEQDWGHVTVRQGAHMFYWLYYTTAKVSNYTERPLTIWLQGGPGASSTGYGNFAELGPLDLSLNPRNHTWVKDMNVLFIDNPVGSGFSYVDDKKYLTTNNKMIALDLVEFMKQFYELYPEFKPIPLHIFCESYGGKMAAEFALELHRSIKAKQIEANLKSVALGDSSISIMDSVYSWAPLLLQLGFVDHKGAKKIHAAARDVEKAFNNSQFTEAVSMLSKTMNIVNHEAKEVDFANVLEKKPYYSTNRIINTLAQTKEDNSDFIHRIYAQPSFIANNVPDFLSKLMNILVADILDIPRTIKWTFLSDPVYNSLIEDMMKPVIHIVEELLNTTDLQVVVYQGQMDLICATRGAVKWVNKLKWSHAQEYLAAPRNGISVDGILEGYEKKVDRFAMYWVIRAGHMVPKDNPVAMSYILKEVTNYVKN